MKTRAAVAWKAGAPLTIETVDLEGPKAGEVLEVGPGGTNLKRDDHGIPLYTPECRQCKLCLSRKTNLCQQIRATQGQGLMPDATSRFSIGGRSILHDMGTSTFANHIVVPEIALAKIRKGAPFDKVCSPRAKRWRGASA